MDYRVVPGLLAVSGSVLRRALETYTYASFVIRRCCSLMRSC